MVWFKVDDKFHDARKTRRALRVRGKRRDAAAIGLWVLAGSWCADNLTDGFVPTDELYRWDDDAETLADRLVDAELWTPAEVDGEAGFQFENWSDYQPMKEDVDRKREAARERMRAVRARPKKGARRVRANSEGTAPEVGSTPTRPDPSRPTAAAAAVTGAGPALPPPLEILRNALEARKLTVRWDQLTVEQHTEIEQLITEHGDAALVAQALRDYQPNKPIAFAQGWLPGWRQLRKPGDLAVVPDDPCPKPGHAYNGGTTRRCTACIAESHTIPKENTP